MKILFNLANRLVNCSGIFLKLPPNQLKQITRDLSLSRQLNKTCSNWGTKKAHRNVKIHSQLISEMADPQIEEKLAPYRASVKEQVIERLQFLRLMMMMQAIEIITIHYFLF